MWQKIFSFSLLFISQAYALDCAKGKHTELLLTRSNEPTIYRFDESIGQSQFMLFEQGVKRFEQTYEGRWYCFGFNSSTNTYLVGGVAQTGAWLPLVSILYLAENRTTFIPSAFNRLNYIANAAIVSPKKRYIAFIGGQRSTGQLYVLDTQTDTIKHLGKAPAPPPLNDSFHSDEPFEWGTGWADSYIEIEPNILHFKSETVLQVSYGKDTAKARAKKRHIFTFKFGYD